MISLTPLQYECMCAVERGDAETTYTLGFQLPSNELYDRGLYTCIKTGLYTGGYGSFTLTSRGRDALMCYRATHSTIGV